MNVTNAQQARRRTLILCLLIAYLASAATGTAFNVFLPQVSHQFGLVPQMVSFVMALIIAGIFVPAFMAVALKLNRANKNLIDLAQHDPLTGLLNRRAFFEEVALREHKRAHQEKDNFVLILDADHFKQVNDVYGHAAGDLVLSMIAMVLKGNAFERDLIARIGGEEFVIYLNNTNFDGAMTAAERIRAAVEENTVYYESRKIKITVSVGCSVVAMGEDIERSIDRADNALYRAKGAGRNCIRASGGMVKQPLVTTGRDESQKSAIRLVATN
jgi:diguanylate cyclase (GGDEF)-like protein